MPTSTDSEEFFTKLARECPTIFREGSMRCWCDCPPGWESLVHDLSVKLEAYATEHNPGLVVDQVKTKFGGLRYYVSPYDPKADDLIREAEEKSFTMCEECGEPGTRAGRGWVVTACPKHKPEEWAASRTGEKQE